MQSCTIERRTPKYHLGESGEFIIENYNQAKPLSSFLPAIAGLYGIPMWVFYVNRGQCIASMGITNKDNAILEFFPANRAYQLTTLQGYRTFLKIGSSNPIFYEPFQNNIANASSHIWQKMIITSADLSLVDHNEEIGIETTVHYFTIPNETFPALARIVTVKNISGKKLEIQLLDGLPCIISHGLIHIIQKDLSRTAEAWVEVVNNEYNAPLFRLKAVIADKPEVEHIPDGHFYINFKDEHGLIEQAKPIIDPAVIFGQANDFSYPAEFIAPSFKQPAHQRNENFTPCAFGFHTLSLSPRQSAKVYSMIGHIGSIAKLNSLIRSSINTSYFENKLKENKQVIQEIEQKMMTVSSSSEFNLYCRQTFLDNVLRGGLPITFGVGGENKNIFHVFSRKHGDLERDYNKFSVLANPFSQGNGNYRDINQNRRNDVWFNPDVHYSNIETFINLIQPDGYNPLVIKGSSFTINKSVEYHEALNESVKNDDGRNELKSFLSKPFTPGNLLKFIENKEIIFKLPLSAFINKIISLSSKNEESEHGEGFWTDHWTYCLDLIESFLSVYPESLRELLIEKNDFTFYHNQARVIPRSRRYILRKGKPFQGHAIEGVPDQESWRKKEETMEGIDTDIFKLKTCDGSIYRTTLIVKLFCIIANKLATLDPQGIGIEMEAGKPNWYDALNGLPGLFGSSINETFELKRLILFVRDVFNTLLLGPDTAITFPSELYVFIKELGTLLQTYHANTSEKALFEFWDKASAKKEHYRSGIIDNICGDEIDYTVQELTAFLTNALDKINAGLSRACDPITGIYTSYFINEMSGYEMYQDPHTRAHLSSPEGYHYIKARSFKQKPLPLFLEGQVHALRVLDEGEAKNLYLSIRRSSLYDRKLMMYKVNADLSGQPEEIGRCKLFTPGWLENESIWSHMQYKYLLELLKNNLCDEYYADFQSVLIPFQDPEKYGRSPLENSSFIVSSAYPDESLHGNGFVARLSGCTAEFLHMWIIMNVGKNPFFVNEKGALNFTFKPYLPGWLFTEKETKEYILLNGEYTEYRIPANAYAFMLFGTTLVTYRNPERKDTFGLHAVRPYKIKLNLAGNKEVSIEGCTLPEEYSIMLREKQVISVSVEFK